MSKPAGRRRRRLSPEEKWEVFLEVVSQQLTQSDAARKWGVDVSLVIKLRRLAKDAALAAFPRGDRDEARRWWTAAAAAGHRQATNNLALVASRVSLLSLR
jgi:transposase-like protein